jgi:ankyrin repeat protein
MDPASLDAALQTLPEGLNETYDRIISSIPEHQQQNAIRILQFLAYSERPMRVEEIVHAIAVHPDKTPAFDPDNCIPDPNEVTVYCRSLTRITHRTYGKKDVTELQLAHASVKEYLLLQREENPFQDALRESQARASIVKISLAYLFAASQNNENKDRNQQHLFHYYAAQHWTDHARLAEKHGEAVLGFTSKLFATDTFYKHWLEIYDPDPGRFYRFHGLELLPAPIYYASLCGLLRSVNDLIDKGADVNAKGGFFGNALGAASDCGYAEIVQLLLERGADVNAKGGFFGNALGAASARSYTEIVQLLLDRGADINAEGGPCGNALQVASARGHAEIVRLLLDNGADVNAHGGLYGDALQAASARGYAEIVQLLLDNGADVNAQGGRYGNALQAASARGYAEIFQPLRDRGADFNKKGGSFSNALGATSDRSYAEIVQLLLDRGADINAEGGRFGNALQTASARGHANIVRLLLDNGADVNAYGGLYGDALQAASENGYDEIVQLLLDNGAKVHIALLQNSF